MEKSIKILLSCAPALLALGIALQPEQPAGEEGAQRIPLPTEAGSRHETIGRLTNDGTCTIFYRGKNTAITAAHCFDNLADIKKLTDLAAGFHCTASAKSRGKTQCSSKNSVLEVAIPQNYNVLPGDRTSSLNMGYDVAFLRLKPLTGEMPADGAALPMSEAPVSLAAEQAGYNGQVPGLTGDPACHIISLPTNSRPLIKTTCQALPGHSGGPLLDEAGNIIGILESVDESTGATYATPVTPALKEAFAQFQAGTLKGSVDTNAYGVRILRFSYTPVIKEPALLIATLPSPDP